MSFNLSINISVDGTGRTRTGDLALQICVSFLTLWTLSSPLANGHSSRQTPRRRQAQGNAVQYRPRVVVRWEQCVGRVPRKSRNCRWAKPTRAEYPEGGVICG